MCSDVDCQIEEGLCHCRCGERAPLAKKTAKKYGHVKGEPVRYINWHYQRTNRLSPVGYVVNEVQPVTAKENAARRDRAKRNRAAGVIA
jgi:hypothetical protein